ncbi:MAG: hypothetical protein KBT02_02370 [Treponema sp.]|nr:hypothetical protein [Candidatus Treponema caballi]
MKRKVNEYSYDVLNDIRDILMHIGMPEKYCNTRCVLVMAACLEMVPGKKWASISEDYHGTHDIISFINTNYPDKAGLDKKGYQENSRETIRDDTIKVFISASLMEEKTGLASNDRNNSYRITSQFASLLRKYKSDMWNEELGVFLSNHQKYSEKLKQVREIDAGYSVNYNGLSFTLGRTAHNKLQKLILEDFTKYFASGALLLYIGDTSDRIKSYDNQKLQNLGIKVLSDSPKLPDIILYDESKNRVLFIEAYSSTGEFNIDRVEFIKSLCDCKKGTEVAFVTAFLNTKKMLQVYPKIAWDTDIWVAEDATHMTHKNGDMFLGRTLD